MAKSLCNYWWPDKWNWVQWQCNSVVKISATHKPIQIVLVNRHDGSVVIPTWWITSTERRGASIQIVGEAGKFLGKSRLKITTPFVAYSILSLVIGLSVWVTHWRILFVVYSVCGRFGPGFSSPVFAAGWCNERVLNEETQLNYSVFLISLHYSFFF